MTKYQREGDWLVEVKEERKFICCGWTEQGGSCCGNGKYEQQQVAYPKLIDGGKESDNVTYWNQMKVPLIEQIQRHDWRSALEIITLLNNQFNKIQDVNTNR